MNTGLDWMWVEILTVMMDWIEWVSKLIDWVGLDLEKWTHGHLCMSQSIATKKRSEATAQPCLTPLRIGNHSELQQSIWTQLVVSV